MEPGDVRSIFRAEVLARHGVCPPRGVVTGRRRKQPLGAPSSDFFCAGASSGSRVERKISGTAASACGPCGLRKIEHIAHGLGQAVVQPIGSDSEHVLDGAQEVDRRVAHGNERILFDIRPNDERHAAVRIDVIGTILHVVLDDENQRVEEANGLVAIACTTCPMA